MKRVRENGVWSLFDPNTVRNLHTTFGDEYEKLYLQAEQNKLYVKQLKAHDVWKEILMCQMETGEPYIMFKDHINRKSNQSNRGTIRGTNLCCEIVEYSDKDNYAVCNLASISLPAFVVTEKSTRVWTVYSKDGCPYCEKAIKLLEENNENLNVVKCLTRDDVASDHVSAVIDHKTFPMIFLNNNFIGGCDKLLVLYPTLNAPTRFDYKKLGEVTELILDNMNIVIDKNYYPVEQAKRSNMEMRPTGIGIQGLADVLCLMDLSWEDPKAMELNRNIYAVVYYHALKRSMELSQQQGPYAFFDGSPASRGILQPDMWNVAEPTTVDGLLDWSWLRQQIMMHGLRNSLVVTQMPTASSAQILGNNESFEPYTTNMYSRNVLSGTFIVTNQHLYKKLSDLGLWNEEMVNELIANNGSIQSITGIPDHIKNLFKTVWEIPTKLMVDYAIGRGPYIDQTQSLNIFMAEPDMTKLSSMFMYEWQNGLKTGMYYLRRLAEAKPLQFTLMRDTVGKAKKTENTCHTDENESCMMCSA
jgi:ribonucleoside-diphosphate reductase alpha subunit